MIEGFEERAIKVRRTGQDQVLLAMEFLGPILTRLSDKYHEVPVERIVEEYEVSFHPKTGERIVKTHVTKVQDMTKEYDAHGGWIRGDKGDYLVKDGENYFVVRGVDRATKKPVFWDKFERAV